MTNTAPARPGRPRRRYDDSSIVSQPDWERHARCAGLGTDFFFSEDEEDRRYAKSVCRRCPVEEDCLAYAVKQRELGGIWGGRTEAERLELLVGQGRSAEIGADRAEDGDDGTAAA